MNWSVADTRGSIADLFARQAALHPERIALDDGEREVTYGELGAVAAAYAEALSAHAEPGARAALLLGGNHELVPAALAALHSGVAVLTLNPGDPTAHLALAREELQPELLVTTSAHLEQAEAAGFDGVPTLDLSTVEPAEGAELRADSGVAPNATAFFISTSGSTGSPKLVLQPHRNVLHNVLRYTNGLRIREDDRIALLVALSGGQGLATTWTALLNGATLCPFPVAERGVTGLADWLEEKGVTVFDTIPSVLRNFARTLGERRIGGVRLVRLASEAAGRGDFEAFRAHFSPDCVLASVLASSECGITAQAIFRPSATPGDGPLPVGYPAEGIEITLEDEEGALVALGETGEIVVRSHFLSPGYWRGEAAEEVDGIRVRRTGDLARRGRKGALLIVGRADRQVKVRGHRLQLEAVERAIASQPGVADAAVILATSDGGGGKLRAYFTTAGSEVSAAALRRSLRVLLPAHAVPASLVEVESLPLTAHGKLDRDRLAELEPAHDGEEPGATPRTETEELLAGIWADLLDREHVAVDEPFLDLGGDSLDAATIAAATDELFGAKLDLAVFAENPTVRDLAALIDSGRMAPEAGAPRPIPLVRVARPGPLSSSQERFLRTADSPTRWSVTVPFSVRGPLDAGVLKESIARLVERHEILRTRYVERGAEFAAVVGRAPEPDLTVEDLTGAEDAEARIAEIVDAERRTPFDLEQGPLLRWRLLKLGEDDHRLVRTSHHILHDAASWEIFFEELAVVYEALLAGRPSPLGPRPELQYIDYAAWDRSSIRSARQVHLREVAWWQRKLADAPEPAQLPFAHSEPDEEADQYEDVVTWGIPAKHGKALDEIARRVGATYYMTRLAAFAAQLAVETEASDLLIGTPVTTRSLPELQRMLGPFINYRPLRLQVNLERPFAEVLAEVRGAVLDAAAYSGIPWERLARELRSRGVRPWPPSASFSAWASVEHVRLGGVEIEPLPRPCGESEGFRVGVNRRYERDRCWADFDPKLYEAAEVARFTRRLQRLIAAVAKEPNAPLNGLAQRPRRTRTRAAAR
jgi:acyl-coenzyme A synthetase/AMP-(fatty) acid ligase/acyl carrier protein